MSGRRPALPGVQKDIDALLGEDASPAPAARAPSPAWTDPPARHEAAAVGEPLRSDGARHETPRDIDRQALMELASQFPSAGSSPRPAEGHDVIMPIDPATSTSAAVSIAAPVVAANDHEKSAPSDHRPPESSAREPTGASPPKPAMTTPVASGRNSMRGWIQVAIIALIGVFVGVLVQPAIVPPPAPIVVQQATTALNDDGRRVERAALLAMRVEGLAAVGRPFKGELADLRTVLPANSGLSALIGGLEVFADHGTPTVRELASGLAAEAPRIAGIPPPANVGGTGGWFGGLFSSQPSPEAIATAILASARADADFGDLPSALRQLERLQSTQRDGAKQWIAAAERRVAIDGLSRDLSAAVFAALGAAR